MPDNQSERTYVVSTGAEHEMKVCWSHDSRASCDSVH